ncbi:MAG: hypothetical protein ACYC0E_02785, partial [Acidimicrobiales bacterium]
AITVPARPSSAAGPTPRQAARLRGVLDHLGRAVGEVTTVLEVTGCADEAAGMAGVEGSAHQVATCRSVPPSSADFPRFTRNPAPAGFGATLAAFSADLRSLPAPTSRWSPALRRPLATLGRDGRRFVRDLAATGSPSTPWSQPVRRDLEQLDAATAALRRALRHLTPV